MKFSKFGERFINDTGIKDLMDDLGIYVGREGICMLGGGTPAMIPEVNDIWRKRMNEILNNGDQFQKMLGLYGTPIGSTAFFDALAEMLNREYGWSVTEKNIAVISGSQSVCFHLYNMLSGEMSDGSKGKVLLPLMPEYIGYADQTIDPSSFISNRPGINEYEQGLFKYQIDFDAVDMAGVNAIAASRPTNPTGNVLTDQEIMKLNDLAGRYGVPLIIDNAYGLPFPGIIFEDVKPLWTPNIVLSMSLSKIGLPATRTGIVVANEEIIRALSAVCAVSSLAPCGIGQDIVLPMLNDNSLIEISRNIVMPFYRARSKQAIETVRDIFGNRFDYSIHKSEGSIFLWIWFKELESGTIDLYNRLKKRGVIIVPGEYFFFGLPETDIDWKHRHQCIRINYSQNFDDVKRGLEIIAEEAEKG